MSWYIPHIAKWYVTMLPSLKSAVTQNDRPVRIGGRKVTDCQVLAMLLSLPTGLVTMGQGAYAAGPMPASAAGTVAPVGQESQSQPENMVVHITPRPPFRCIRTPTRWGSLCG